MRNLTLFFLSLLLCSSVSILAVANDDTDFTGIDTSVYDDEGFGEEDPDNQTPTKIDSVKQNTIDTHKVYDLNGCQVNCVTQKGIYIINGKKVVVR